MSCLSNACAIEFSDIQLALRSSGDRIDFIGAKTLFAAKYPVTTPVFKSHTDYVHWKRAQTQLKCCK